MFGSLLPSVLFKGSRMSVKPPDRYRNPSSRRPQKVTRTNIIVSPSGHLGKSMSRFDQCSLLARNGALRAFCVFLILLLAACGKSEAPAPAHPTAKTKPAQQAEQQKPAGFALSEAKTETYDGQLAIALIFTDNLAGAQAFDGLISVSGNKGESITGSWALDEDGKTLRFPFVKADQNYTVAISNTLAAADGKTLPEKIVRDVYTGPLAPAIGFASQGNVLPARGTRGLPVVSVNVNDVDVEFLRVRDDELSDFFSTYQRNGKRSGWELDHDGYWDRRRGPPLASIADSVYSNRFALESKQNERALSYLPVQNIKELAQPGLYFAVMKRSGSFSQEYETSFFFVSDIGMHTRVYRDKLWLHAASLKSGEPLSGVDVQIVDGSGNSVVKGKTDGDGNVTVTYELKAEHVLVARSGQDVSILPFNQPALDLSDFAVSGRKQEWFDVFAWSGRDLYRPGETLRLSALLRDFDGKPIKPQPLVATLKQPDGRTYETVTLQPKDLGYLEWSRNIPADAPTGRWTVEFRLDPAAKEAAQNYTFRVEEFLPERLKLALDSKQPQLKSGEALNLDVQADYLYGAPAAGNRFTARMTLAPDQHPIETHKDFFFGDPTLDLPKKADDIIDTKLDDKGTLSEEVPILDSKPTAPVAAVLSGSVYESGGRTVTRVLKRTMWPAETLVGVRPLFDVKDGSNANANAGFEVINSNAKGDLLAAQNLKVTLVREYRDYHWTWDKESGWHFDFTQRYDNAQTRDLAVEGGKAARIDFPVEWGNYRIEITDPSSGLTTRYPFVAGWSWDDENRGKDARPDKVKLALDKEHYKTGDTLKVTVTPPHPGPGVLIVESDHLLYTKDVDVKAGATFDIPVTADWERHDVYVTALVFRPGSAADKVTPARAVGEAHVSMDRAARAVSAEITAPKLMKPETELPVTIKAAALAGKPAWATISAVDVGILNITRFAVPDASDYFFAQRRLGIDSYDLYGRIIESYDGTTAKLRYGGDMAPAALPQARRPTAKVLTVDLFSGPVQLDAKGEATVKVKVPDFNGTLRVSTLVYGENEYANANTETIVRAPLVAEVSTPRAMAPGDLSSLNIDLQNFSGSSRDFNLKIDAKTPLIIADTTHKITLADGAKKSLTFPLRAAEDYGVGKFSVSAESIDPKLGDIKIHREFEVAVRPAWPSVLKSVPKVLDAIAPVTLDPSVLDGFMAGSVNARLTVSALPPLPFSSAVHDLIHYPYGCIEQTTSKAWAVLLDDDQAVANFGIEPIPADRRKELLSYAMSRISSMQIPSGHFSMWGGDSYVNEFMTPYVVEFLLDARDAGVDVPDAVLQKALKRLNDDLLSGGHPFYGYEHADHLRFAEEAYSGYVLARVQRAPLGTLRALYDNSRSKSLTALPLVHLGIALSLQGDKPRGEKALDEAFAKKVERPWYLGDYGSDLRDASLMIALVHQAGLSKPEYEASIIQLGRDFVARRSAREAESKKYGFSWLYLSTQEQLALFRLGKTLVKDGNATFSGQLTVGDKSTALDARKIFSRTFSADQVRSGVHLTPQGNPPLYMSQDIAGVPRTAPQSDDTKVWIKRSYYTLDGQPYDGHALKEGEGLVVGIAMEARQEMADALLTDLLPGGLEIENFNLSDAKQWADVVIDGVRINDRASAAEVRHEEFRDDRYVAALKLYQGQKAHSFYVVRAVSPGTFVVPPPLVEDMYRPEIRGVGKSEPPQIKVVEP
jgi:alpha-2-macroglobulin